MTMPLVILSACCLLFGMFPTPLMDFIDRIASALFFYKVKTLLNTLGYSLQLCLAGVAVVLVIVVLS